MRLASIALLAATTLGLAACNKGPSVDLKNVTPAEVAKAMKDSGANRALIRPGKWQSTMTIIAMDTAQLPPEIAAKINAQVGKPRSIEACLTPKQVDAADQMIGPAAANCRYEHYTMGGGKIDGHMTCTGPAGSQEMTVNGTYAKDQYAMTVANKAKDSAGAQSLSGLSTTMKVESHRLGDCDAKPAG